jgi:hypothetical protein
MKPSNANRCNLRKAIHETKHETFDETYARGVGVSYPPQFLPEDGKTLLNHAEDPHGCPLYTLTICGNAV